jgi:hypothetical protein
MNNAISVEDPEKMVMFFSDPDPALTLISDPDSKPDCLYIKNTFEIQICRSSQKADF